MLEQMKLLRNLSRFLGVWVFDQFLKLEQEPFYDALASLLSSRA